MDAASSFAAEHRGQQCIWTPTVCEFLEFLSKEPGRAKDFRMLRYMAVMSFEKCGSQSVYNIDQAIKLCAKPPQEGAATAEDVCYAIGLHMADGNALLAEFYIGEHETQILNFLEKFATGLGLTVRKRKPFEDVPMFTVSLKGRGGKRENMLMKIFRSIGYLKTRGKTVSDELEMNLLRQPPHLRRSVIAGFIDGDGHAWKCRQCGEPRCGGGYIVSQNVGTSASFGHDQLIRLVQRLARSLGLQSNLHTRTRECGPNSIIRKRTSTKVMSMHLTGKGVELIPCKQKPLGVCSCEKRKQPYRGVVQFEVVEHEENAPYAGFELKDSPLFLLENCMVVHNCKAN